MALSKIRLANKKARRESGRKIARSSATAQRRAEKTRRSRMRKMMRQGQQEHKTLRRQGIDYVKQLEAELDEA